MKLADRIQIIEGDLTEMDVDAIVNAAKLAKFPSAERPSRPVGN
jgi:hypothetical protein